MSRRLVNMFDRILPETLDDPEFKEDSVRQEIVGRLMRFTETRVGSFVRLRV